LQKYKTSTEPYEIVKPLKIKDLLYLPSEIEIIDIYHTLYSPDKYDEWDESLIFEDKLFKQIAQRKESGILGGGGCQSLKRNHIQAIKISIVKIWLKNKKMILIGPWAHDWIKTQKLCINLEKIQVLSFLSPEEFNNQLQRFLYKFTKFDIIYKKQELHIPKDLRTVRYTYYMQIQTSKGIVEKPFLDMFPVLAYEIIPCKSLNNILIGTQYVLLRFLFIDLWIIRVIKSLGFLSPKILNIKLSYLWKLILFFHDNYQLPGDTKWIGTYKNETIEKKISALLQRSYYPYYPEAYKLKNNKYRTIG